MRRSEDMKMQGNPSLEQQKFLQMEKRNRIKVILIRILILIAVIGLWELTARMGILNDFIFSSPSRMFLYVFKGILDGSLFLHIGITLGETIISFLLVTILSIILAIVLWYSRSCCEVLEPYLVILNSLPKSALAPVLIVWIGNNVKTIIVTGVLIAVFSSAITLTTSFKEIDADKIKLIYSLGGSKKDVLWKVTLPGSIPVLISTMKVNIGLCLVGVIIGEFLAAKAGLGYLIIYGSQVFKMDMVMASIVILCIISVILYQGVTIIQKRIGSQY